MSGPENSNPVAYHEWTFQKANKKTLLQFYELTIFLPSIWWHGWLQPTHRNISTNMRSTNRNYSIYSLILCRFASSSPLSTPLRVWNEEPLPTTETHALPTMTFSGRAPGLGASPRSPGHPLHMMPWAWKVWFWNNPGDNEVIYEVTILVISGPCNAMTGPQIAEHTSIGINDFFGQGILLELDVRSMSKSP